MATSKKTSETKKTAAKKVSAAKKTEVKDKPVKAEIKPEEKPVVKEVEVAKTEVAKTESKGTGKTVAIVILSGVLIFSIIVFVVLFATGVIKFNGSNDGPIAEKTDDNNDEPKDNDGKVHRKSSDDDDAKKGDTIDNPYAQAKEEDETLVHVGDLEFYLPEEFEAGGKNKDGAYTYNLTDDDGWAQVLVYAEYSSLSPSAYLHNISSSLEVTNRDRWIKGTSWTQAENANCLAFATKLDGKIYAVYFAVKLDSDATDEAMKMIPKTLYMKKIIKE